MQCLLVELYFAITLEQLRLKQMDLSHLIGLIRNISQVCAYKDSAKLVMTTMETIHNMLVVHDAGV